MTLPRFLTSTLLLLAALCAASPTSTRAQQSTLEVQVAASGAPVAGAEVVLEGSAPAGGTTPLTTAEDGLVRLTGVSAGRYTVRVEKLGYRPWVRTVDVGGGTERVLAHLVEAPLAVGGLVVEASRTAAPARTLPTSITVVGREALGLQAATGTGLNSALAKAVPGLGVGTGTSSTFGQSFRGRNIAVFIDGVPQSTGRNVLRDLATVDPALIERVEVLRGANALFGDGATGGVINVITRSPGVARRLQTAVSLEAQPSDVGDGLGWALEQSAEGAQGAIDYLLTGRWSTAGSFFDGEGDMTPPDPQGQGGLADYREATFLGKLGIGGGDRRAELSLQFHDGIQDTEFTTDPTVDTAAIGSMKARAVPGLDIEGVTGTDNLNVIATFDHRSFAGGALRSRAFFRDYETVFGPFDGRSYLGHVAQSFVDSRKLGLRFEHDVTFDVAGGPEVVWGVDLLRERSFQGLNLMDPESYDDSHGRVFRKVGEAQWVPDIVNQSLGIFAQFGWFPVERLSVRGGIRHEQARVLVDDFTTVTGNAVDGGRLSFDPVLLNVGAVFNPAEHVDLFASFSQGFSLADIGRVLRAAPEGFTLGSRDLGAQRVDHYEAGVRTDLGPVSTSASAFYNESDLGTNFTADLDVVRAPERVRGFEASLDTRTWDGGSVGGSLSWSEGESYDESSGTWIALNGFRIQPLKTTAYVEHRAPSGWMARLQVLSSGSRDRAFEDGLTYGHLPIDGYTLVDGHAVLPVGPGRLSLGVENVFDTQYFPVVSQLYSQWGNSVRAAGRGRTVRLEYRVGY